MNHRDDAFSSAANLPAAGSAQPNAGGEALNPQEAEQLAAALAAAAKATDDLAKNTEKVNRLYANSPAVKAAKELAALAKQQAESQQKAGRGVSGGGVSGPPISRHNPDLDAVMGAPPTPPRPVSQNLRHNPDLDAVFGEQAVQQRSSGGGMVLYRPPTPTVRQVGTLVPTRASQPDVIEGEVISSRPARTGGGGVPPRTPASLGLPGPSGDAGEDPGNSRGGKPFGERFRNSFDRGIGYARIAAAGYESIAEANKTPFMDDRSRGRAAAEGLPLVGDLIGMFGRFLSDVQSGGGDPFKGQEKERKVRTEVALSQFIQPFVTDLGRRKEQDYEQRADLEYRARQMKGYRPEQIATMGWRGVPFPDRGTIAGRNEYELRKALLPAKDRIDAAEKERDAERAKLKVTGEREGHFRGLIIADEERIKAAQQAFDTAPDDPAKRKAMLTLTEENTARTNHREQLVRLSESRQDQQKRIADAEYERSAALRSWGQVRLTDLERREDVAREQATRLGMMGVDGRMQTMLAKRMVDQIGIENAPGELIQQANAGFPQSVQEAAQKAGQQFVPQFRQFGKDEFRDDVPNIAAQVDEKLAKMRTDQVEALGQRLGDVLKAVEDNQTKMYEALDRKIEAHIQKYIQDSLLRGLK